MKASKDTATRARLEIGRRDFLRLSALAVGSAAFGPCGDEWIYSPEPLVQVAAVRGNDLRTMTYDALDAIGGIGQIVGEGETVFIKPNMVTLPWAGLYNTFYSGECAKPDIIIAVAEECLRVGASEVIVGDGSHMPVLDWQLATTLDGSTNLVAETARLSSQYPGNATVASLEVDSPEWVQLPSRTYLGTVTVSSLVARADRVISIAVAKTHCWAQLTLSLKNFIGVTPLWLYGTLLPQGYWDRGLRLDHRNTCVLAEIYLDIVDALNPDLAIIDFSYGVEGNGPSMGSGGQTVDVRDRLGSWLLLASNDLVAADATAARIMNHEPADMTQLRLGYHLGLGEIRENRIEMVGERLDDLRMGWTPALLRNQLGGCLIADRRRAASTGEACEPADLPR